jgi:nitrous oxidase accessory protein NosD
VRGYGPASKLTVRGLRVRANRISGVPLRRASPLVVAEVPDVTVEQNTVVGGAVGIYAWSAPRVRIAGNQVLNANTVGILVEGKGGAPTVLSNVIWNWDRTRTGSAGIRIGEAAAGLAEGNVLYQADVTGAAVRAESSSKGVIFGTNTLLSPSMTRKPFGNFSQR